MTSAYYFQRLREIIALQTTGESDEAFDGEIELDESYFGKHRKGKRGRRAKGSRCLRPFEAWLQGPREGYSRFDIGNTDADYREKSRAPDSIVYTDCWKGYNALDVSRFRHYRINHSFLFADEENHINRIENFWSQAERHLRKYNGIPRAHFPLYLKECGWQFSNPSPKARFMLLKQ